MRAPTPELFTSRLRGPSVTARVGVWLGVCFVVAFLTGLVSHLAQAPGSWLPYPTRPTWGYRVTQGLHVASGTAAVPLLLVKLWSVYPRLFLAVPRPTRERVLHLLERLSVLVLVSSALFLLASGLANVAQWYPWGFTFRRTHGALGWVAVGALLVHVAVNLPGIRAALAGPVEEPVDERAGGRGGGPDRRLLLRATWTAAASAVLLTAGATVPALRRVSLFAVRSGDGPGGVPVNKSARAADVVARALDPSYRLEVVGRSRTTSFARADLAALPQVTVELPIACVEGWSAQGRWTGVRVRDLLAAVDGAVAEGRDLRVVSLQRRGPYRVTTLPAAFVADPLTVLALRLGDEELALDHGYPVRLIAPNRPGVLQTKWVSRLEVV